MKTPGPPGWKDVYKGPFLFQRGHKPKAPSNFTWTYVTSAALQVRLVDTRA